MRTGVRGRSAAALAVAGSVLLVLVGCTPPPPTVLPSVVVEREGTSDFETDEFVAGVRAWDLGVKLAWNARDFTIDEVTEHVSAEMIEDQYDYMSAYVFREGNPGVYVGPRIWAPVSVTVSGDTAEIEACVASQDNLVESGNEETSFDLLDGELQIWTVKRLPGDIYDVTETGGNVDPCDASAAQVLRFDPVPVPEDKITEADIRPPV